MADALILDLQDDVPAARDARASLLDLCLNEYLRRRLSQEAVKSPQAVKREDVAVCAATFANPIDPKSLNGAWT